MIPKSTAKLQAGDFCWIEREDKMLVPFVYVCKQGNSRSYFYGGIAHYSGSSTDVSDLPSGIEILEYALLHIKCFKENNTPVIGNISQSLAAGVLESIDKKTKETGVGSKSSVWGHRTIYKYANAIEA